MAIAVGKKGLNSDINVTPLVDVILVLLIIFMVVVPNLQRGEEVHLPKAKNVAKRKADAPEPILLAIRQDGKILLQKDTVDEKKLSRDLRELLKKPESHGKPILVKADERLTYGKVRKVLELLQAAGLAGAGLATISEDEEKK
jgi:biopolymer transport protein ExbD/biopolymer transport protein TolR